MLAITSIVMVLVLLLQTVFCQGERRQKDAKKSGHLEKRMVCQPQSCDHANWRYSTCGKDE